MPYDEIYKFKTQKQWTKEFKQGGRPQPKKWCLEVKTFGRIQAMMPVNDKESHLEVKTFGRIQAMMPVNDKESQVSSAIAIQPKH